MSLVTLFVIEFFGWIAFNRITPFSVSRVTIAMSVSTLSAALMSVYASAYSPLFVDTFDLWAFVLLNTLLTLIIAFVSFTRDMSNI